MSNAPDLPADLLALAREDLAAAEALDSAERVSDSPVGFHAQQAVEKALKAVIASRDQDFPFTHDVGLLMQLCQDAGLELPAGAYRDRSPNALRCGRSLWPRRSGCSAGAGCLALGCNGHRVGGISARPKFLVASRSHRRSNPAPHAAHPQPFKPKVESRSLRNDAVELPLGRRLYSKCRRREDPWASQGRRS
jgi:HEPN domain-containing protein